MKPNKLAPLTPLTQLTQLTGEFHQQAHHLKKNAKLSFAANFVPGVKQIPSTGCASPFKRVTVSNCVSFHFVFKTLLTTSPISYFAFV